MRFMYIFLLSSCFLAALGRTVPVEEQSRDSEADYEEGDDEAAELSSQVQEEGGWESGANEDDSANLKTTEEPYNPQAPSAKTLTAKRRVADYSRLAEDRKRSEEPSSRNEETPSDDGNAQQSQLSDGYENDPPETTQLTKRNMHDCRKNRNEIEAPQNKAANKVAEDEDANKAAEDEDETLLFENNYNKRQQKSKDEYHNKEDLDQSEQSRFFKKRYYNEMGADNRGRVDNGNYDNNANRDRRHATDSPATSEPVNLTTNDKTDETVSESEEAVIKRHVQKLSSSELEQLLGSLSEDKRSLLQKIMESNTNSDFIDKRETAKKSGAVEENLTENFQLDNMNLQRGTSIAAIIDMDSANDQTEANKTPNEADLPSLINLDKSPAPTDKPNMKSDAVLSGEKVDVKADSNIAYTAQPQLNPEPGPTKSDIKRESNEEYEYHDDDESLDQISHELERDTHPLQDTMLNDEELSERSENQKRDTQRAADFGKAMKSLEESFPNPTAYEETDPYFGEEMAPLVRVKRKNRDLVLKKRFAAVSPDSKVSYFPSNAKIDEHECDEEANEFDEERYNFGSNFEKSNIEETENAQAKMSANAAAHSELAEKNAKVVMGDSTGLGSDTDSVLDGVEGVDDNLMYSSRARDRRSTPDYIDSNENVPQPAETFAKSPQYQENDAFGPLPTNYESEQSRYKRIRGVGAMSNDHCNA